MVIDEILDRRGGFPYDPKSFYTYCVGYASPLSLKIAEAMDEGEEEDVKKAIHEYLKEADYDFPEFHEYVDSVNWL